jgi:hypothetical protein
MRKTILICGIALSLVLAGPAAFAGCGSCEGDNHKHAKEEVKADGQKAAKAQGEVVEKTGTIEIKKAEKGEKFDTVLLKIGDETLKIIPGKGKKEVMKELEQMGGKEIVVKGTLLPADEKHPLAAIKIDSYAAKAAADPKPAEPTAAPADPKPTDEKPADPASAADEKPADK